MNTALRDYITTDRRTEDVAAWLVAQLTTLRQAAPAHESPRLGELIRFCDTALTEARASNQKDNPNRRLARDRLLNATRVGLEKMTELILYEDGSASLIAMPTTVEAVEARIADIIQNANWTQPCAYCGLGKRRLNKIKGIGGDGCCAECVKHYGTRCNGCNQWHAPALLRPVYTDQGRRAYKQRQVCEQCMPEGAFICTGHCHSAYMDAPCLPKEMTQEEVDERGWKLCRGCAAGVFKCRCGKFEINGRDVIGPTENQEDADNDGRGANDVRREHVCEKCHEECVKAKPRYWDAALRELVGTHFDDIRSKRRYGVEIEVCYAPSCNNMPEEAKALWHGKQDGSLPEWGVELASVPLSGDEGLSVIRQLCEYAEQNKWAVTGRAGMHLHMDMSEFGAGTNQEPLAAIAFGYLMTYRLWSCFIAPPRLKSTFCQRHNIFSREQVPTLLKLPTADFIKKLMSGEDRGEARYKWVNFQAFKRHRTVEVRSHQGTIDYEKISNWIKAHLRFADWCVEQGSREAVHRVFSQEKIVGSVRNAFLYMAQAIWKDRNMARWFRDRASKLAYKDRGQPVLPPSTRQLRKAGINPLQEV
jgi:hypothetical protein